MEPRRNMVTRGNPFDHFSNPNTNPTPHDPQAAAAAALPPISNLPHAAYASSPMDGPPPSPYDHGSGPPNTSQPYAPATSAHEASSSLQYPQYSYDIQLRYPPDQGRSSYPQDIGRQYEAPRPYAESAPRHYAPETRPYPPQDVPRQYAQDGAHPYAEPDNRPYNPVPMQGPGVPLPSLSSMTMPPPNQSYLPPQEMAMDTTGQLAPPGMKPRVTATLWEDEGTLCFQVDVKGMCVARREDNHMINGTKLLNVALMTRGRRDGILKAEKQKHVVKIGPMHLKGVWIPYERALEFANKENITPALYPLFVHNIGALLYHPINHSRGYPTAHLPRGEQDPNSSRHPTSPDAMSPQQPVMFNSREEARPPVYS